MNCGLNMVQIWMKDSIYQRREDELEAMQFSLRGRGGRPL